MLAILMSWDNGPIHVEIRPDGSIAVVSTRTNGCVELSPTEIDEIIKLLVYARSCSPIGFDSDRTPSQDTLELSDT